MMKWIRMFLILCAVNLISSCAKDEIIDLEQTEVNKSGDSWYPHASQAGARQLHNVNGLGWGPCEASSLTLFIPACLDATNAPIWNAAINAAIDNYNNAPNTSINFTVVGTAAAADISFTCDASTTCFGGNVDANFVNTGMSSFVRIQEAVRKFLTGMLSSIVKE